MIEYGKYIIVEVRGHEVPILFSGLIDHSRIADGFRTVLSAGRFSVMSKPNDTDDEDISVGVFDKSITLNKGTRPDDKNIIKEMLRKSSIWG